MDPHQVSIIIPAYNAAAFIAPAIASLLAEPECPPDILVVNDGSTDATRAIVARLADGNPRIRLIDTANGGVSRARNIGLAALPAACRFVGFLDADDLNVTGRIGRQASLLSRTPDLRWVAGLMQFFETPDTTGLRPAEGSRIETIRGVQLGTVLFDRRVFDTLGGFAEDMAYSEDTDFFLRLLESGMPYVAEDAIAVYYRRHPDNATNDIAKVRRGFADAIRRSLARRRQSGASVDIGPFFKTRAAAEEVFQHG